MKYNPNIYNEKSDQCDNCGNSASSNPDIIVHSTKSYSEPIEPDNCGNTASSGNTYYSNNNHIENIHDKDKNHCDISGNTNVSDINVHVDHVHDKDTNHCDVSGNNDSSNVNIQVKNVHDIDTKHCDLSGKNHSSNINIHVEKVHDKDTKHCNIGRKKDTSNKLNVHTEKNHEDIKKWRAYDLEFKNTVNNIIEDLTKDQITYAEAATIFNNNLTLFLESKSEVITEIKAFYQHKLKSTKVIDEARKIKHTLQKKAQKKDATYEDKKNSCEALRHYNHMLKEHTESLEAIEINKQEKAYRYNFHKFAKETTNGTYNQPDINPTFSRETANKFL